MVKIQNLILKEIEDYQQGKIEANIQVDNGYITNVKFLVIFLSYGCRRYS